MFKPTYSDDILIDDVDGKSNCLHVPENMSRDALITWVNSISSAQMPNWIGLPNNAENVLLTGRGRSYFVLIIFLYFLILGKELLRNILKVTGEELAYEETLDIETKNKGLMWASKVLADQCRTWLQVLPEVCFN